ncbi:rhomboid family intramembrane serine protease [Labrys neptuniae]|uniref:Rhomboid family intramembrane serine protease n=1 Tax=Labrys neptuniae TaxID=376174 RepID=A0ABV3PWD3_9HYPH
MSSRQPPLWHRALFGPMPLAYPLAAVCAGLYLLAVLFTAWLAGSPENLGRILWQPSQGILYALGTGGQVPFIQGRVWTVFTAPYLHGSLPHLALNLFSLLQVMPMVERTYGRLRAFVIYAIGGIAGAVASVLWGEVFSLGASGAIFGLLGAIVLYGARRGDAFGRALMTNAAFWAGLNFLYGLLNPGISNAGHFGGFLGGLAAAVLITRRIGPFQDPRRLAFTLASLALLALAFGLGNTTSRVWQFSTNDQSAATNSGNESAAAEVHMLRALVLAQRDDYEGALREVDLAIKGGRDDAVALNLRAWSLFKLGRAEEGLADAEAAVKAAPDEGAILDTRAHIYEALGRREEAIADYKAALRLIPNEPETQAGLKRLTGEN